MVFTDALSLNSTINYVTALLLINPESHNHLQQEMTFLIYYDYIMKVHLNGLITACILEI